MAFRGGGRGRGGYGRGGYRFAKQESFVLFPDIELPDQSNVPKEVRLIQWNDKFRQHLKDSPYFLEETLSDKGESFDVERYSDKAKRSSKFHRGCLSSSGVLKLEPGYFPLELVRGTKRRIGRKVQWNPKRDLKKLDLLEELEEKDNEPKSKKENGTEENEEEEEDVEEEEEEESDEGDYEQGEYFDDDEDDFNMEEDGDDEGLM